MSVISLFISNHKRKIPLYKKSEKIQCEYNDSPLSFLTIMQNCIFLAQQEMIKEIDNKCKNGTRTSYIFLIYSRIYSNKIEMNIQRDILSLKILS